MFLTAAMVLSEQVPADRLGAGALYPSVSALRHVSRLIAIRVIAEVRGVAPSEEIAAEVDAAMWFPAYRPYRAV
jgi:hypothetical protein